MELNRIVSSGFKPSGCYHSVGFRQQTDVQQHKLCLSFLGKWEHFLTEQSPQRLEPSLGYEWDVP